MSPKADKQDVGQEHVSPSIDVEQIDALGQEIRTLVDDMVQQGAHSVTWNGTNSSGQVVPSGIYFYVLNTGDARIAKKMVLMK